MHALHCLIPSPFHLYTDTRVWLAVTPSHTHPAHTHAHMEAQVGPHAQPAQRRHPYMQADTHNTHRLTDRGEERVWPGNAPDPTAARPGRLCRHPSAHRPYSLSPEPTLGAPPSPVPCPPMLAPASWAAAPHRSARHGPLEAGTGLHLRTRVGGGQELSGCFPLSGCAAASLLLPAEPSGGLAGLSPGLDSETDFWESTVARSCNPETPACRLLPALANLAPTTTPPTLIPSEPACRVWPPLPRLPATPLMLPLRSPPASVREQDEASAGPCLAPQWCLVEVLPPLPFRDPAYLQKASSAPRSPLGVQKVPMSCFPAVGLAQCLLGNL